MGPDDTIFALSSGSLPSGVAVVRISGTAGTDVLVKLTGRLPRARQMQYGAIGDPAGGVIDQALYVYFPGPRSFTGEDVVELSLHGSRATVNRLLEVLGNMPNLRPAEAGEFTLRAFRNGKIDLTEAEALSDLLAAETERQRQLALANASGLIREKYREWRKRIIEFSAMTEAVLDFTDEEDAPDAIETGLWIEVAALADEIESHVKRFRQGQIIRDGFRVTLFGPPNAGKSSLMNALAGRDVAIVTDEPGTTRDLIEVDLNLNGFLVKLFDTAGIRETAQKAEAIGVERSLQAAAAADLVLLLQDASRPMEIAEPDHPNLIRVGNKLDLLDEAPMEEYDVLISTHTGAGMEELLQRLARSVEEQAGHSEALPFRERHVRLLQQCARSLRSVHDKGTALELVAEDFRYAASCIGRITGAVDVEDLLDVIFSRFCIGK